jgi:hypothetical protein
MFVLEEVTPCEFNVQKPPEAVEEWIALYDGGFAKFRRSSVMSCVKKDYLKLRNWLNVRWATPLCTYEDDGRNKICDDAKNKLDEKPVVANFDNSRVESNVASDADVDARSQRTKDSGFALPGAMTSSAYDILGTRWRGSQSTRERRRGAWVQCSLNKGSDGRDGATECACGDDACCSSKGADGVEGVIHECVTCECVAVAAPVASAVTASAVASPAVASTAVSTSFPAQVNQPSPFQSIGPVVRPQQTLSTSSVSTASVQMESGFKIRIHMDYKRKRGFLCDSKVDAHVDKCRVCNGIDAPKRKMAKSGNLIVTEWIGCNNCSNWFHSTCLPNHINEDTFVCQFCTPPQETYMFEDDIADTGPTCCAGLGAQDLLSDTGRSLEAAVTIASPGAVSDSTGDTASPPAIFTPVTLPYRSAGGKDISLFKCNVCQSIDMTDMLKCCNCKRIFCHKDCVEDDQFVIGCSDMFVCRECV